MRIRSASLAMPRPRNSGRTIQPTSCIGSFPNFDSQMPIAPAGGPGGSGTITKYHSPFATVSSRIWCTRGRSPGSAGPPSSRIVSGSSSSASVRARCSSAYGTSSMEGLDRVFVQEADHLTRAALGVVLEDEVARALHQHELGIRDLPLKAVGAADRREGVVLAPNDQRRDAELGEPALVGRELDEVARAVEREMPAPLLLGGVGLPVLLDGVVVEPAAGLSQHRREALALDRVDDRLTGTLGA